jgi:hypothetical protein
LGEGILEETRVRLSSPESAATQSKPPRGYTWDSSSDIEELRATGEFRRFTEGGQQALVNDDVVNALNAFPYTPKEAIRSRLITLREYATRANDAEAVRFVDALRDRFEAMVNEAKRGGRRRG